MNRDELRRRLLETFSLEMEDHLQAIGDTLEGLSSSGTGDIDDDRQSQLNLLFRAVHSLKGAARSVNLNGIEEQCHQLESLLAEVKNQKRSLSEQEHQRLYQGLLWLQENKPALSVQDGGDIAEDKSTRPQVVQDKQQTSDTNADREDGIVVADKSQLGRQDSVRLPAARLDNLLSMIAELHLVSHAGGQLLQTIDELSATTISQKQAGVVSNLTSTSPESGHFVAASKYSHSRVHGGQQERQRLIGKLRKQTARFLLDLELSIQPLEREIHTSRLQSFRIACEPVQAFVNAQSLEQKSLKLTLEGQDVEMDRALIERLRPVLMHLARNALDHGLECRQLRLEKGKPETGKLLIRAERIKGYNLVTVQDDGRGVDETKLKQIMRDKGLAVPEERDVLLQTLFEPGMSTTSEVSKVSGRGVGLDAVRSAVNAMRGTISMESESGRGVSFRIQLPQTLSAYKVLAVELGQTCYVIDASQVKSTRRLDRTSVINTDQGGYIRIDNVPYPLVALGNGTAPITEQTGCAVLLTDGKAEKALLVDHITGLETVVVKDLESKLGKLDGISGGAIMADGTVSLLLDVFHLLRHQPIAKENRSGYGDDKQTMTDVTVMVVEDVLTTRMLETHMLESEGYKVLAAVDGQQAWEMLRDNKVDLVVSDVDMPRLDGFELTRKIRDSAMWSHVPVILLTARENPQDKLAGLNAGANLYMKKSQFDQTELLEAVKRLVPL